MSVVSQTTLDLKEAGSTENVENAAVEGTDEPSEQTSGIALLPESNSNENARLPAPSYQMRPSLAEAFKANKIKDIIQKALLTQLQGKNYSLDEARIWTKEIADSVNSSVRLLNMRRFKHVVQVTLGQHLGSGCSYIARCRWDAECDSQTSDVFSNATIFCVCTVFGIYLY